MNFSISTIFLKNARKEDLNKKLNFLLDSTEITFELWMNHLLKLNPETFQKIKSRILSGSIYENFHTPFLSELNSIILLLNKTKIQMPLKIRVFLGNKSSKLLTKNEKNFIIDSYKNNYSRFKNSGFEVILETHQGTILDDTESIIEIVNILSRENIEILLDIHNLSIHYPLKIEFIKKIMPLVTEVHVKNSLKPQILCKKAPGSKSKIHIENCDIDKGFIDWKKYFRFFKTQNFNGNVVLEWFSEVSIKKILNQYEMMKNIYENS